jgi:hypothetical protein
MIEIVAAPSSLARSATGSITGQIFLRAPAGSFPEDGWSDFPVVILCWWIQGLRALAARETGSFQGLFMDGPYAFVVQRCAGASDEISWGHRGVEAVVGSVSVDALLGSAVAAARTVATACRARGWASRDLDNLEDTIESSAA